MKTEHKFFGWQIVLLFLAVVFCVAKSPAQQTATFTNPLIKTQDAPDPWIIYHQGFYYFTATLDPSGGVWLWRSKTLSGLETSEKIKIYDAPLKGGTSKQIWAPEIHQLNGKWYVYFTASNGIDETHRIYVLENKSGDPFGKYALKGKVAEAGNEGWAIDPTVLVYAGKMYLLWVAHVPGRAANGIRMAPLANPWTIGGKSVLLIAPQYQWEQKRFPLDEAPEAIEHDGKLFLTFSASDTGTPDYALGLLTFTGGDLMHPQAWQKTPEPVFKRYSGADGSVFAPGHNGFFKSPDGTEDWIIYHGKETDADTYAGRQTRAQKFTWRVDGTPDFGHPLPSGVLINVPAGESLKKNLVRKISYRQKFTNFKN